LLEWIKEIIWAAA